MDSLEIYTSAEIGHFFTPRTGEQRIGDQIQTIPSIDEIAAVTARYIVVGIPEDVGVRANFGVGGASSVWASFLRSFLAVQCNDFLSGGDIAALGHFVVQEPVDASITGLRTKVNEIDALVSPVIQKIVAAGKIPIVIGGGHNNAYPVISGVSLGLSATISTINIDAHADIRPVSEGRHSGNGFSAALQDGLLHEYAVFGLHESYNNQYTLDTINSNPKINALFFDELCRNQQPVIDAWRSFTATASAPCGLEVDLDSIKGILSSATSPSGFTLEEVRQILSLQNRGFAYLHICEGATRMADGREDQSTGKAIAYLVTDFIKAQTALK